MFNKEKIEALERRIHFLEDEVKTNYDYSWEARRALRVDLEKLATHLGLKFENVNERRVVAIKTFEKFKK